MIELRRLSRRDLPEIERIERKSYATPWSRTMFASELAKRSSICLGAFTDPVELVGHLIVSRYVDAWHIMNVVVVSDYRRQGVATLMLDELFDRTCHDPLRGYTLEVRVSNDAAICLYERLGFTQRGMRHDYYTDNREDAIVMWKDPSPVVVGTASAATGSY